MGIDALDLMFRLENEFGVQIRNGELWFGERGPPSKEDVRAYYRSLPKRTLRQRLFGPHEPIPPPPWFDVMDMTAAEAMSRLMRILIAQGKPIPEDCWPRVRKCIAETVGAQVDEVELDSRLISDLGFE